MCMCFRTLSADLVKSCLQPLHRRKYYLSQNHWIILINAHLILSKSKDKNIGTFYNHHYRAHEMNRYSELLIDYSGPALNIINGNSAYDIILATRNYGKLKHKSWAFDKEFTRSYAVHMKSLDIFLQQPNKKKFIGKIIAWDTLGGQIYQPNFSCEICRGQQSFTMNFKLCWTVILSL